MLKASTLGLCIALGGNFALRAFVRLRADKHEKKYHPQTEAEVLEEAQG